MSNLVCAARKRRKSMSRDKRVVVIGAGPTGLCAAKHALAHGYDVTVYEQANQVGGTWIYTDRTGNDDYGLPISTSMYKNMLTNLPIETMGFPDFPFTGRGRSFVPPDEVLEFLVSYADQFNVIEHTKFEHHVIRVAPTNQNKRQWEVIVRDLRNDVLVTKYFDYAMVCNGHYSAINMPEIPGMNLFEGTQIHSHSYRRPEAFEGKKMLLIGFGPSGSDMVFDVSTKAELVLLSTHRTVPIEKMPSNVVVKSDVKEIKPKSVVFVDGSEETIDAILYCTGYNYSFPFLSVETGICRLEPYHIHPLYKHCINIEHPTMALIGVQMYTHGTIVYDMQVKLCFRYWNGEVPMPTKQEMLDDTREEIEIQFARPIRRRAHWLGERQAEYLKQLSDAGAFPNLPEVYVRIFDDLLSNIGKGSLFDYRNYNYRIIDDYHFEKVPLNKE